MLRGCTEQSVLVGGGIAIGVTEEGHGRIARQRDREPGDVDRLLAVCHGSPSMKRASKIVGRRSTLAPAGLPRPLQDRGLEPDHRRLPLPHAQLAQHHVLLGRFEVTA
jgi:hypothetical protein